MHTLTYTFPGPAHRPPLASLAGAPVVVQLAPLYASASTSGTPYLLATLSSVTHADAEWTYTVALPESAISGSPTGKMLPTLHAFPGADRLLLARPHRLNYEVFGPTEDIGGATRWVGNPGVSGTIVAVRVSVHTAGTSTVQLSLAGTHLLTAPANLNILSQLIRITAPITAGQRINAITTGTLYGKAKGLQIEFAIRPNDE